MNLLDIKTRLQETSYPGRGIILGRTADDSKAMIAYFIMGRSVNSRNRVFEETADGIRTKAHDESKMEDPSLIIYHPVRVVGGDTIVTNGDQTDTIRDYLVEGRSFEASLRTREFEPDCPNYTPRISGIVAADGSYKLSILKSMDGDPACCCRYFYEYDKPQAGVGHFIHTYQGDGNPLPSFEGEPERIALEWADAASFAEVLWGNLNEDNKVSLFVRTIDIKTGETETVIINRHS
ncbi:MAG: IMP cyclohydrolase [Oscillospiraceae bacterium]|nr:IMP cyclohydrolase [Oscillospiraceae bacterium]